MPNKDYDEADGVFDIDDDDADHDLDNDAEETAARPPKPKAGLARETKVGLSVIAALLVVFIVVLVYRLSRPANDAVAKSPNESEATTKTSKPQQKADPVNHKPTVVTPARQGSAPTNPWSADLSKKSQSDRKINSLQSINHELSATGEANPRIAASGSPAKNPFDARPANASDPDSRSQTFGQSNSRPGSAYGSHSATDGQQHPAESLADDDGSVVQPATEISGKFPDRTHVSTEPRDPFGPATRKSTLAAENNDSDPTHDDTAATNPPRTFSSTDLLNGSSAAWDEKQDKQSMSAVPGHLLDDESDKLATAKRSNLRSAPAKDPKLAADPEAPSSPFPAARKSEPLRFGRAQQPADTIDDETTEAPRFAGPANDRFKRNSATAPATQIDDADQKANPRTAAPSRGASSGDTAEQSYTARAGDTYWKISQHFYGSGAYFKALYEHNRRSLQNPDRLQAGADLKIPDEATLRSLYPDLCPAGARKSTPGRATRAVGAPHNEQPVYVVEDGDTLYEIARRQLGKSSRWGEIFELNRELLGDKLDALPAGAELVLPADARRASATRQTGGLNSAAQ